MGIEFVFDPGFQVVVDTLAVGIDDVAQAIPAVAGEGVAELPFLDGGGECFGQFGRSGADGGLGVGFDNCRRERFAVFRLGQGFFHDVSSGSGGR